MTYNVTASGEQPLSYQWTWNNIVIAGATASSYTTPTIVPSDNGSTLSVNVSNAIGTLVSAKAALMVSQAPRAPKPGDLRFKDVDSFPFLLQPKQWFNILGGYTVTYPNCIGTPLELSGKGTNVPMDSSWSFIIFNLPDGAPDRTTIYKSDSIDNLNTDLNSLTAKNAVIVSLDLCASENDFAWEELLTPSLGEYQPNCQILNIPDVQAAASLEGKSSRVITAASISNGQATLISYGWKSDTSTVYEAQIATPTIENLASVAISLSQQGYILTAIGGNTYTGFILVGTRVQGDTTPRSLAIWTPPGPYPLDRGYSYVGHIFIIDPNNAAVGTELWLLQQ